MKALIILISIPLWVLADTISYESFKQKALGSANIIKQKELSIDLAKQSSKISQNFANPSVDFGKNRYKQNSNGWQVGLSQSMRLPGFSGDLKRLNSAKIEVAKASYLQTHAEFLKNLEFRYTAFVYQKSFESLLQKELELLKRIENIATSRLQNGVGAKSKALRASIETQSVRNELLIEELYTKEHYLNLLLYAGIVEQTPIEAKFIYLIEVNSTDSKAINPDLIKAEKEQEKLNYEADALNNSIKSVDLLLGYEKEPEDKIVSIGAGLNLPIFSTAKEKSQIARIKAKQNSLELDQLKIKQELQKINLENSLLAFSKQYSALKSQQSKQENLLKLYEEGYQISKGSLLELIEVKNSLLQTSKNLLNIQKEANLKRIELNYIQGNYNE